MGTLFLLPEQKLSNSPSALDNLSSEDEYDLRVLGCELIQSSGLVLKLPQTAMATAQVLFHRFYYSKSLVRYSYQHTAMACVVLAAKIEEAPKRIRDVIDAFQRINQLRKNEEPTKLVINEKYVKLKNEVVKAERRILKELGFCVYVNHPHKFIVSLLQILHSVDNQKFVQTAWSHMNDGLRTDVFLRHSPETIACSCVYLSARILGIPLPETPPWWEIFLVNEKDIREVCKMILKLYTRRKPDQERLESVIDKLKKQTERSRSNIVKQFSATAESTPATDTDHEVKKIKIEHIVQDAKKKASEIAEQSNNVRKEESKRKKIHERNHSRSPRRSRPRSRERKKYSSKAYDSSKYSLEKYSSKAYDSSKYSLEKYSSKAYDSNKYSLEKYSSSKDYPRDYPSRDYNSRVRR